MKHVLNQLTPVDPFEEDDFPGRPKILFIGLSQSSHTHSWIDLLTGTEFNVRLFSSEYGTPPQDWEVRTYVTSPAPLEEVGKYRNNLHLTPLELKSYDEELQRYKRKNILFYPLAAAKGGLNIFARWFKLPELYYDYTGYLHRSLQNQWLGKKLQLPNVPILPLPPKPKAESPQAWLAQIIRDWQPDIIHTLGVDHNQGGIFFYQTFKQMKTPKKGTWVVQLRGGSDLTLNRHDPEKAPLIREILESCDQIISDNIVNIEYASAMGIPREKFASITPVPGTGGIDVEELTRRWEKMPSERERIILWTKAYDCEWSVALPVFEALQLCWEQIQPCKVYMLAMTTPGTQAWFHAMPPHIRQHCITYQRIPREEVLDLMLKARVLLTPSLVDGVPNSLYEAMACGTFPIVSPLDTIKTVLENERNVLFARNMYPQEIADAFVKAMNDDVLVDQAVENNLSLVRELANRTKVQQKVVAYYESLVKVLDVK